MNIYTHKRIYIDAVCDMYEKCFCVVEFRMILGFVYPKGKKKQANKFENIWDALGHFLVEMWCCFNNIKKI